MRAGLYCRISRDTTGEGLGVQRQERECRALCETLGWEVVEVYVDNDISAYANRKRRAGYQQLCDAIRAGTIGAVVAWHPDRLHRRPIELEEFIDIIERTRCKVATVQAGHYDLATATGRMTARVVGAVARHESEQKSERLRSKHRDLARKGQLGAAGGVRAFGYEADYLTIRLAEARLIREAATRVLAGDSVWAIACDWTDRGVSTVSGSAWSTHVLVRMLTSGRIAGIRYHDGQPAAAAVWPGIIDEDTHMRLRAILLDPVRRTWGGGPGRGRKYLLTGGLIWCGRCGAKMIARPKGGGRRAYHCATGPSFSGCGKMTCLAEPLEADVVDRFLAAVAEGRFAAPAEQVDVSLEVLACEQQVGQLAADHGNGLISRAEWHTARAVTLDRLDRLRASAMPVVGFDGVAELADAINPKAAWDVLPLDQQRARLFAVGCRVTLNTAIKGLNRYDRRRVHVEWGS